MLCVAWTEMTDVVTNLEKHRVKCITRSGRKKFTKKAFLKDGNSSISEQRKEPEKN